MRRSGFLASAALACLCGVLATPGRPAAAQVGPDPALEQYYNANSLCQRHFYKLAAEEYRDFLKKYPTHAKAAKVRWGLAICLYNMGELKEAEPLLAKLAGDKEVAAQEQLHNLWGACLLEQKRLGDAEKAFAWTIANGKDPKARPVTEARVALIETLYLQSKWAEAVAACDEMLKVVPEAAQADNVRFQGAVARLRLKQYAPALAEFQKLAAQSKDAELAHRALFHQAECLQQTGKLDEAAGLYETAARTRKGSYSEYAAYDLGLVKFLQGRYDEAIAELRAFQKAHPRSDLSDQAALYLARAYVESGSKTSVSSILKPLMAKSNPLGGQALLWYARSYARQDEPARAEGCLAPVESFAKDPAYPSLLHELGTAQMNQDKFPEGAKTYGRAAAAAAAASDAALKAECVRLEAYCLHRARKFDDSIRLCEAFLTDWPKDPKAADVTILLAENLMLLNKGDEALAQYQKFFAATPDHPQANVARLRRAQVYCSRKQWTEALADLTVLPNDANSGPDFGQVKFLMGDCHAHLGDWDRAAAALEQFIREQPKQPNVDTAMFNLALAYQRKDLPPRAIDVLTRLLEERYRTTDRRRKVTYEGKHLQAARLELGRLLYDSERYDKAKEVLTAAVKTFQESKDQGDGSAEYYLAWIALKQDDRQEAAKWFEALAKYPAHPFATDSALQTAILHIHGGRLGEAQAALERMLKGSPNHPKADQATYYMGLCLARRGRYDEALKQFGVVLAKYPKGDKADNALYWQARCQEKQGAGGPAEAAKTYEKFLTQYPNSEMYGDVIIELAKLQYEAGQTDKASSRLAPLLSDAEAGKLSPALRQRALYMLGWCQFKANELAAAAKSFETLVGIEAKGEAEMLASALFQAGECRRLLKDYSAALSHFEKAVATSSGPTRESALLRQAECEGLLGRWRESEKSCAGFLDRYGRSKLAAQARYQLGWAMQNQRQYAKAIWEYRKLLAGGQRDEVAARAQFQFGECLVHLNQLDEAIKELVRVEALYAFPEQTANAIVEIGRVLEMQKKNAQAIARYKEVIERFPDTPAAAAAKMLLSKHE